MVSEDYPGPSPSPPLSNKVAADDAEHTSSHVKIMPARGNATKNARSLVSDYRKRNYLREKRHLEACGKQVSSTKASQPCFTIAPLPSRDGGGGGGMGGVGARHSLKNPKGVASSSYSRRCREITEHPSIMNPSPMDYDVSTSLSFTQPSCNSIVLRDWSDDRRFLDDESKRESSIPAVRSSTHASPFSSTFPYDETVFSQTSQLDRASSPQESSNKEGNAKDANLTSRSFDSRSFASPLQLAMSFSQAWTPAQRQQHPQTRPDLNYLYIKYQQRPRWKFGSSSLGSRFPEGRKFSRVAPCKTTSRLVTFRELRERIEDPMQEVPATTKPLASTARVTK